MQEGVCYRVGGSNLVHYADLREGEQDSSFSVSEEGTDGRR